MYLSPIIPEASLWLLCACFLCLLIVPAIYFYRVGLVVTYRRKSDRERADKADADYLPASVIIYSQGEASSLYELLKSVLEQNYPAAFEVIVVNEGESSDVRDIVSTLRARHNNLYLTFTPEGVVNLSRKKLALTLGIKAARYDIVVLTTTAAEIVSSDWLRNMMRPFDRDKKVEVVLGYSYIAPDEDCAFGKRCRAFDYVFECTRWLGAGIAGKPFRGTEYNIAYRREAFMRNKGFARSLNLCYGDDDIFISEIANRRNTVVELSEESMVRLRHGNHPRIFMERSLRHLFTERKIRRRPRFLLAMTGWLQLAAIVCAVFAAVSAYPNMQSAILAAVMVVLLLVLDIYYWRRAMVALKSRRMFFTLPLFAITYSMRRMSRRIRSVLGKQKRYTWD